MMTRIRWNAQVRSWRLFFGDREVAAGNDLDWLIKIAHLVIRHRGRK